MEGSQYYHTLQGLYRQKQPLNLPMTDEHYKERFLERKNITAQTHAMTVSATGGNRLQPTHPMFAHFDRLSDTFRPTEPLSDAQNKMIHEAFQFAHGKVEGKVPSLETQQVSHQNVSTRCYVRSWTDRT